MRRYEPATVARFPHVVAVSENDRELMSVMTDSSRITVVPTGVDTTAYRTDASVCQDKPTVMFLGSMDWPANSDGVELFCEQVWPNVIAALPDARFQVVGRNPSPRTQRLASDSVSEWPMAETRVSSSKVPTRFSRIVALSSTMYVLSVLVMSKDIPFVALPLLSARG